MNAFTMWKEKIVFINGWFVYMDGKGNNSIISHARARAIEEGYQRYQASMDVNRGGYPEEMAFPSRGFTLKGDKYVYEKFCVDQLITAYLSPVPSILQIPRKIGDIEINCVAKEAFKNEAAIEKVIFHEEICCIGISAFEGCKNLCGIELSNKCTDIHRDAFKDTLLYSAEVTYFGHILAKVKPGFKGALKVQKGTLAIADEALNGCTEITQVDLPDGLISIGASSFKNCLGLVDITLPETVQTIGANAFSECTNLVKIKLPTVMEKIGMNAFEKCESLNSVILPEGISIIEGRTFYKCGNLFELNIPITVTGIARNAFDDSGIFTAYKSGCENALYIGNWLIHYKSDELSELIIQKGTVGTADMDWSQSRKIKAVVFPDSLKYIGSDAFKGALINSVKLPPDLLYIGQSAFSGTALKEVCIPGSVGQIEQWAFMGCEGIERIIVNGSETNIVWPAITGRRDEKQIIINAPEKSNAKKYCEEWGQKYNLIFEPLS